QGVPLRPRRGSGHRRNTGVDCALVCGERTLWVSAQDLRGVSRCRRARYRRTLSLHRIPVWDPSANPRLGKMGWRTVRLYPPPDRGRRNKQAPVSLVDTPRVAGRNIRKGSEGASVCIADRHIGTAPRCVEDRHTSRKASPTAKPSLIQGSLTARAPVQAGDAGSSPAPVASDERGRSDGLMGYVANVIEEQLHDLGVWIFRGVACPGPRFTIRR